MARELMIHDVELKWFYEGKIDLTGPQELWVTDDQGNEIPYHEQTKVNSRGETVVYRTRETPVHRCYSDAPDPDLVEDGDGERGEKKYRLVSSKYY